MTTPTDDHHIRGASALVHAVPGAAMEVALPCGATMVVGHHPAADVSPCEWRRFLLEARDPGLSSVRTHFRVRTIGGALVPISGGVFADRGDPAVRWLCTELDARSSATALRHASGDGFDVVSDAVSATVRPDPHLGVTVVGVRIDAPCRRDRLDDVAIAVLAELMVTELAAELLPVAPTEE